MFSSNLRKALKATEVRAFDKQDMVEAVVDPVTAFSLETFLLVARCRSNF